MRTWTLAPDIRKRLRDLFETLEQWGKGSQAMVARDLRVRPATVNFWAKGKTVPKPAELERLCGTYNLRREMFEKGGRWPRDLVNGPLTKKGTREDTSDGATVLASLEQTARQVVQQAYRMGYLAGQELSKAVPTTPPAEIVQAGETVDRTRTQGSGEGSDRESHG